MEAAAPSPIDVYFACEQPYIYSPLPPGKFFRSLALEPGSDDEPLQCSIHTSAIAGTDYEALSYVWGSEVKDCRIYCEDKVVRITTNLFQALRRLRSPVEVRRLWADSVCINQDDLEEKSYQVLMMGHIYSSASRVLVYMGPDPDGHGLKVASLMRDMRDFLQQIAKLSRFDRTEDSIKDDLRWLSFKALVHQPWFTRGWVTREIGLAVEGLVIWGQGQFHWADLMHSMLWVVDRDVAIMGGPPGGVYSSLHVHMVAYQHRHPHGVHNISLQETRFLGYLGRGRHLHFKDRRDNIYAFLDLQDSSLRSAQIIPDYTKTVAETYKAFAVQYIRATGDSTILNYVMHNTTTMHMDLPSWVPRWDKIEESQDDHFWQRVPLEHHQHPQKVEVILGDILKIKGTVLDQLHYVSDIFWGDTTPAFVHKTWQDVKTLFRDIGPRPRLRYGVRHFIWVLLHTRLPGPNNTGEHIDTYVEGLERHFNGSAAHASNRRKPHESDENSEQQRIHIQRVHHGITEFANAKRFVITKRGHIGMAPATTRKGDICAMLYGCKIIPDNSIYILRRTEKARHFRFVGPAWSYDNPWVDPPRRNGATSKDHAVDDSDDEDGTPRVREQQDIYLC